jgi:hypothetical protein
MTLLLILANGVLALGHRWHGLFTVWTARKVESAAAAKGPLRRRARRAPAHPRVRRQQAGPAVLMIHGLAGQLSHYTYGVAGRWRRSTA